MLLIAAALLKKTDYLELTYRERCEKSFRSFAAGNKRRCCNVKL